MCVLAVFAAFWGLVCVRAMFTATPGNLPTDCGDSGVKMCSWKEGP